MTSTYLFLLPIACSLVACQTPSPSPTPSPTPAPADVRSGITAEPPAVVSTKPKRVVTYYSKGSRQLDGHLDDGVRSGTWTAFSSSGYKTWQGVYVDGALNGPYSKWSNGAKIEEGVMQNDLRHGRWLRFNSKTARVLQVSTYRNGQLHGEYIQYHATNGKPQTQGEYRNNQRHGTWLTHHAEGAKASRTVYVDNKPIGVFRSWYASGQNNVEGKYEDGKPHGTWITWNEDGTVQREREYVRGKTTRASTSRVRRE